MAFSLCYNVSYLCPIETCPYLSSWSVMIYTSGRQITFDPCHIKTEDIQGCLLHYLSLLCMNLNENIIKNLRVVQTSIMQFFVFPCILRAHKQTFSTHIWSNCPLLSWILLRWWRLTLKTSILFLMIGDLLFLKIVVRMEGECYR